MQTSANARRAVRLPHLRQAPHRAARRAALALVTALTLALSTLSAAPLQAAPRWTVQVDPLTTALGFVHVQVERAFGKRLSVYVGPHLRLFDSLLEDKTEAYTGVGVEVGVRFFPFGRAPSGLWAGIRGVGARLSTDQQGGQSGAGGYGSALVGYTLILRDRWVLAGGLGVQYLRYRVAGMGPRGVFPAAHTTLGVAF